MRYLLSILFLLISWNLTAQQDSISQSNTDTGLSSLYEISLLTCGTGEELYASFGHTAVKVVKNNTGEEKVYNYGTFNFLEEGFYKKFTLGKLNYWLAAESFPGFVDFYGQEERWVKEQVLDLDNEQAEQIITFLENNAKEANKYYKYDFIYDNCATRVRDVFNMALGTTFNYGPVIRGESNKVSFRQAINQYLMNNHWSRFGINIVLGSRIDEDMTDQTSMFLPDFLYEGTKGAMLDGKKIVKEERVLVPVTEKSATTFNGPFWMCFALFIITLLVFNVPALRSLKKALSFLLLLITGILGLLLLFMWFVTDHQACDNNWNVLWALPTNFVIAFVIFRKKEWFKIYALAAISTLIVSLIIHVIGMQMLPLTELIPIFGALMFVYMDMYRVGLSITAEKMLKAEA